MLARKQRRDEHPADLLVVGHAPAIHVLVLGVDELLQHVFFLDAARASLLDHLGEDVAELLASLVALAVRRDGQVRRDGRDGDHALVEVVEKARYLLKHLLADFAACGWIG